jgi:hypothetical protein
MMQNSKDSLIIGFMVVNRGCHNEECLVGDINVAGSSLIQSSNYARSENNKIAINSHSAIFHKDKPEKIHHISAYV